MCIPYVTKQTFDPTLPSATRTSRPPLSIIGRRMTKLHTTTTTAAPLACTRWLIQLVHNFLQIHTETHLCQYEPIRTKCRYRMLRNRVSPVACSREREREGERGTMRYSARFYYSVVCPTRVFLRRTLCSTNETGWRESSVYTLDQRQFRPRFIGH